MIIGNFNYDPAKDVYAGEIKTLTLLRGKVNFRPVESKSDKGPHYRVTVEGQPGSVELGAAWKRKSEAGRDFLSSASMTRLYVMVRVRPGAPFPNPIRNFPAREGLMEHGLPLTAAR